MTGAAAGCLAMASMAREAARACPRAGRITPAPIATPAAPMLMRANRSGDILELPPRAHRPADVDDRQDGENVRLQNADEHPENFEDRRHHERQNQQQDRYDDLVRNHVAE